jgi:hypothetical protein
MPHITINDQTPRAAFAVGATPSSGPFNIAFELFDPTADLKVYVGETLATYASSPTTSAQFSFAGTPIDGGYEGGAITLGAAISNTTVIVIRDIPVARTEDFPYPSSTLDIKGVNTAFDKAYAIQQQLEARLGRALRQPDADSVDLAELPLAASRASKFLAFDAAGQAIAAAGTSANLGPVSGFINTLLDDADAAASRGTLAAAPRDAQHLVLAANSELSAERILTPGNGLIGADAGAGNAYTVSVDASLLRGYLAGLTLANNVTDAANDIDIAPGVAVDDGHGVIMKLAASLTKRLDAAWSVGTNQGGLDSGSEAANTWYHVWLIRRPDTGVVDTLFSTSATAPTMPANYTQKRRIGAVRNDAASMVLPFYQFGDDFLWKSPPALDVDATNPGSAAVLRTLTVPLGVRVNALMNVSDQSVTASHVTYISSPDVNDLAASLTVSPLGSAGVTWVSSSTSGAVQVRCMTNLSSQVRTRLSASGASDVLKIATLGWSDYRGRFD